jgi:mRNA interferase RelE/StbE
VTYSVIIQPSALSAMEEISDRRIRQKVRERIEGLAQDPEKQGKPLWDELLGYRSIRAVGQRYRIIYRIEEDRVLVIVVLVGILKEGSKHDIYNVARKLFRLHLLP